MLEDPSVTTGIDHAGVVNDVPDPEVAPRAKARTFTADYKKKILAEFEGLTSHTERGALLRREGLYSTLIRKWQHQAARDAGRLAPARPGPKADPAARELAKAQRRIVALEAELEKSRRITDVQAKLSALLGDLAGSADTSTESSS